MHQNNGHDDQQPDYQLAAMAGIFARMDRLERRLSHVEQLNKRLTHDFATYEMQRGLPFP